MGADRQSGPLDFPEVLLSLTWHATIHGCRQKKGPLEFPSRAGASGLSIYQQRPVASS